MKIDHVKIVQHEEQQRIRQKKKKPRILGMILRLILAIGVIVVLVLVLINLLKGESSVKGEYPANIKNNAVTCKSSLIKYPKITKAESDDTELDITMIFRGEEELKSISLTYTMKFEDEEAVKKAETFSHAEFNFGLEEQGYNSSAFNNKFSRYGKELIITLFAESNAFNDKAAQYFLLNDSEEENSKFAMPTNLKTFMKAYQNRGFTCTSTSK